MGLPGIQTLTWTLCVLLCKLSLGHYIVAIPGVIESGTQAKFCASLLKLNQAVDMTVVLKYGDKNMTLFEKASDKKFHECAEFQAPTVQNEEVHLLEVSVQSNTFHSKKSQKIMIKAFQPKPFVQTDKPIYLPGQTVNFRVFALDGKLRPASLLVSFHDPLGNRIGQWLNETSDGKILELSYSLSSEAREGIHQIILSVDFCVFFSVLPKFEVTLNAKDEVSVGQEEVDVEVCAKYTFGQPVPGTVKVKMCRPIMRFYYGMTSNKDDSPEIPELCDTQTKQVWLAGFQISLERAKTIQLSYVIGKLSFIDTPKIYNQNSTLEGKVSSAGSFNISSNIGMQLHVFSGWMWSPKEEIRVTTDSNGTAPFSISTSTFAGDVNLHVSKAKATLEHPQYRQVFNQLGFHTITMARPPSPDAATASSLEIKREGSLSCNKDEEIVIKYTFVREAQGSVDVMYLVVNQGEVSFTFNVSPDMAPNVQIVAYAVLPSQEFIAHHVFLSTGDCFKNEVSVEFSPSSAVPGEEAEMQLSAHPNSLCGVSAIDQSVLIKEPEGFYRDRLNGPLIPQMSMRLGSPGPAGAVPEAQTGSAAIAYDSAPSPEPVETVRTFFPETWIWDLVEVGDSGKKTVTHTVPDTITTWETETFCLSSQGFGLAPRQKFTVFQPFFLELTLPYSIIRGENFELKATVFNYLSSCIMVKVTPTPSSDYTLTALSGDLYTSCLCGNERKTLRWNLASVALGVMNVSVSAEAVPSHASCNNEIVKVPERGRIDKVTRSLIVKTKEIQLPDNVIEGSARGTVSVLGDILGRALKNLDGLLQMPYGCGEQNMALLAPDIYILHYLKSTNQLTPEITEKVSRFLKSGYQRQLNYKDSEGAYTTFGSGPGNTWLTAFVLRSFYKAQSFIFIDEDKIQESRSWLERKQTENGCFAQSGKLFNNRMKGGVSDEVTLSAYITAAFLEMKISPNDPVLNKSLLCLKNSLTDLSNTYTTALLAYVFTLAEDMETRDHLLKQLDNSAIREGGFLHWSQTETGMFDSLSVEITSYVLMAKLGASPTSEDLGYASSIVRWLSGQQNYYGGFSSTQDTVVALQALALYSSLVFTPGGSSTVTLQSPGGQLMLHVNPDNKLVYQESVLQKITGSYNLEVKGSACAAVQVSGRICKILMKKREILFSLAVCLSLFSYTGKETNTNMVIIDIAILSGFTPNFVSSFVICVAVCVQMQKDVPINHSLVLEQQHVVQNLKPAVVTLYDYYQPSKSFYYKRSDQ
uniref:Alpha-2-macroglobulin domain-containing protein n=1 Tax=Oryzias melastigma TaxID=30732 RepID=A0A3B3DWF0_ORYME